MTTKKYWQINVLTFAAALLVSGCTAITTKPDTSAPKLFFKNAAYEFEYAGPNNIIQHEFRFTNTSPKPVKIEGLSVCCGCEAQVSPEQQQSLAPSQSGSVLVTCTMPRYEGPVEKVITLHTNIPNSESIPLTLAGQVKRGVVLTPSALYFGRLQKGHTSEKSLRVLQMSDELLTIKKIQADSAFYNVKYTPFEDQNHKGYDVTVQFTANGSAGTHSDVITIFTSSQRHAKIDVPIVAQIVD